jgi:hypothetical protein
MKAIRIYSSDRWGGYASLMCAIVATCAPWAFDYRTQELTRSIIFLCFGLLGFYFALRGWRRGSLPCKICARLSLVYFVWCLCGIIVAILSANK